MKLESEKRPIIKGKVGDKEAYFLLDTGASLSLIDEDKVKKYELVYGKKFPGTIVGAGGEIEDCYYCNSFVEIGDKKIAQFILTDISSVKSSILRETGLEILGIIGYPQIKFLGIALNPRDNKIYLN